LARLVDVSAHAVLVVYCYPKLFSGMSKWRNSGRGLNLPYPNPTNSVAVPRRRVRRYLLNSVSSSTNHSCKGESLGPFLRFFLLSIDFEM
jgi:hypothetical protein